MKFEAGDVVYLKSNPEILMTVAVVLKENDTSGFGSKIMKKQMWSLGYGDGDIAQCRWFNGPEVKTDFFKTAMLAKKT